MNPQALGQALETLGPFGIIICFIVYLLIRDKRQERNGNGHQESADASIAATQETMAQTIKMIEDHGSVPFQVYVAANEEKFKNVKDDVKDLQTHTRQQSDRLDVVAEGSSLTRQILNSVIDSHNRINPESPVTGTG